MELPIYFPCEMAALRKKRKLAAVARENQEEYPSKSQSQDTAVPRIHEDYNIQVSEERVESDKEIASGV